MNPSRGTAILATILAPCFWGSTYIVFTESLPLTHPLLVGALRALPAGLLLMLLGPGLPPRSKLLRLLILGSVNIGLFFGFLFISAGRLPGGVAATVLAIQPLLVGLLAFPILGRRPRGAQVAAALAGVLGVSLLVLGPTRHLDPLGLGAALFAAALMSMGTILIEKWGRLGSPLALTAWQLTLGGLLLLPVAFAIEGLPTAPSALNALGLLYLIGPGTALAYWLWVRGVGQLGADVAFLSLLSPVMATLLGAFFLNQWFSPLQLLGMMLIFASTIFGMALSRARPGTIGVRA